jgi:hypothetical protein
MVHYRLPETFEIKKSPEQNRVYMVRVGLMK